MECRMKPLFKTGEDVEARPIRIYPQPPVLTPDHAAEAERLCEEVLQGWIRNRRPFSALGLFYAGSRRFLEVGKPWLLRALSHEWPHRLARQQAEIAGWEAWWVERRDGRTTGVYFPDEHSCRAWLRKQQPSAFQTAARRRAPGKPGRTPKRKELARFAMVRIRRKPRVSWADIAVEYQVKHPEAGPITAEMVRSAVRRWRGRLGQRKTK